MFELFLPVRRSLGEGGSRNIPDISAFKVAVRNLKEEILATIPEVRVFPGFDGAVEIGPEQEVYGVGEIRAQTLEEARAGVAKMRPVWREWNDRGLEAFLRLSGQPNPGHGNIQVHPSPIYNTMVGVKIGERKWVVFRRLDDGTWTEIGTSSQPPER